MIFLKAFLVSSLTGIGAYSVAEVDFSNTVTTGSIVATGIVVITAGLFTIRANTAKIWRENYEGEREAREAAEKRCFDVETKMLKEREEQQILRHELKTEIAALKLKTDLTSHEAMETERHEQLVAVLKGLQQTQVEIIDTLRQLKIETS